MLIPVLNVTFSATNPDTLYVGTDHLGVLQSTDGGQTFSTPASGPTFTTPVTTPTGGGQTGSSFNPPTGVSEVLPDPIQSGRLIGAGDTGIYQSTDGGNTWTQESTTAVQPELVADPMNGVYYAASGSGASLVRISANLQIFTPVGPPRTATVTALSVVNGQLYAANQGSTHVFVTKLDPSGNILYSTYFGGSANDRAIAMAVDAAGDVYVTGTTTSLDFPVSEGAYASSGNVFLFKLNPDGSLGYSTYFSGTLPGALAADASGSVWLAGTTEDGLGLPVTPGVLETTFCCPQPFTLGIGPSIVTVQASLTRFNTSGSGLIFSTYLPGSSVTSVFGTTGAASALEVSADETAYVGGAAGIFHIDSTGTSLLASMPGPLNPIAAMAFGPDGSLYVTGTPSAQFQTTPGAFQTTPGGTLILPGQGIPEPQVAIAKIDAGLKNVIAATWFTNLYSNQVSAMATDPAGNVYIGGKTTSLGLPTRTPFQGGFATPTGFMAELSGDLTTLLFSSYFGDNENFTVSGVGIGSNGSVLIGGATGQSFGTYLSQGNLWLNSLALTPPPALRIDSVQNAASLLDTPLSAGETIVVNGAGFGNDSQVSIGGAVVATIGITSTAITATVPANVPAAACNGAGTIGRRDVKSGADACGCCVTGDFFGERDGIWTGLHPQ